MSKKSPLDDLFRRRLRSYEVSPPDNLWDNIQMARAQANAPAPGPHRNLFRIKWYAVLLLAGAGITASLLYRPLAPPYANELETSQEILPLGSLRDVLPGTSLTSIPTERTLKPSTVSPLSALPLSMVNGKASFRTFQVSPSAEASEPATPRLQEKTAISPTSSQAFALDAKAEGIQILAPGAPGAASIEREAGVAMIINPLPGLNYRIIYEPDWSSGNLQPRFRKKLWFAKVDLLVAHQNVGGSLHAPSETYGYYASLRNDHESFDVSQGYLLRMGIASLRGWGLRSGIHYSRIGQTLTLLSPDASGRESIKNTFHLIDIPVLVSREFSLGPLRMGFSAGPYLNMAFNQRGSFFGPDGMLIEFTSSRPGTYPAYRNRLGASLFTGISLAYPLGGGFELLAEPHLRSRIPVISAEDYPLEQKIWYGGLSIGLRRQIGKGFYLP